MGECRGVVSGVERNLGISGVVKIRNCFKKEKLFFCVECCWMIEWEEDRVWLGELLG